MRKLSGNLVDTPASGKATEAPAVEHAPVPEGSCPRRCIGNDSTIAQPVVGIRRRRRLHPAPDSPPGRLTARVTLPPHCVIRLLAGSIEVA